MARVETPEAPGSASLLERMRTALSGRYLVEREIGRGAMATVYLARDLKHDRQVAIKVLAADLATAIGAKRFLREIQVAAQLLHPNILGLIDSGDAQGSLYYIMPYVRGETLRDKLEREKRLSVSEAIRIASEVASALEHAHEYGVIHRDIKPENILLVNGHHATVADFGLARAVFSAPAAERTSTGLVVGSPYYMSPEQASGEHDIDGRTDIYGLGCVLFEMLTGEPPFKGKTVRAVLLSQMTSPVPRVRTRRADLSVQLDELVQRTLAKEPADRFQSAHELSAALAHVRAGSSDAAHTAHTARPLDWLRAHWKIVLPFAALTVLAALLFVPFGTDVRNRASVLLGAPLDTARYVVLPFRRAAAVPAEPGVAELVHDGLQRWRGVDVIDQFQTASRLHGNAPESVTPEAARSVAIHFRAGRFVWGDVTRSGDSLRIDAAVYDTKSGRSLHREEIRVAVLDANMAGAFIRLADELLFRGAQRGDRVAAAIGTNSYAAHQAYLRGKRALDDFNLAAADSGFSEAVRHDREYASAHLWLGQVRGWAAEHPFEWQGIAERAAAGRARLSEREQRLADALVFMAKNELPQACGIYRHLRQANPSDFVAAYGIGECNRRDSVVIADARSPSGWSFRSSAHEAAQAYREAFELIPGLHKAFHAQAFRRVRSLVYTAANIRRGGRALPPDTTQFRAAPSWQGDTLAFVPYPLHQVVAHPEQRRWPSTVAAVDHQRAQFREIAAAWRSAYPSSPETLEAMAVALELQGDSAAIDTLRAARRLADSDALRRRLAANEVLLMIKFGVPDNTAALLRARTLADSLLQTSGSEQDADAELMASIAALTGRAHTAARIARKSAQPSGRIGARAASNGRALLAYAAIGAPTDSIKALERRIVGDVRNTIAADEQVATLNQLLGQAAGLSFSVFRFPSLSQLAGHGNRMVDAQFAYVANDRATALDILTTDARRRASLRPSDLTLDITYPAAALLMEIDGDTAALNWLDPVLSAAQFFPPEYLSRVANAGAFMRGLLLRADLARRAGDPAEAARWQRPFDILWANSDPGLKAAIAASHARLGQ